MELREILEDAEISYETVLSRFSGSEVLLKRFLLKFPQDPTYRELEAAAASMDMDAIERGAHTLKGVSANLGFDRLSAACAAVVSAVRAGENGRVPELFGAVRKEYRSAMACIGKIS